MAVADAGACRDLGDREAADAARSDLFPDDEQDGPLAFGVAAGKGLGEWARPA